MHGWSALRVSLNHFPRVASPPEGSLRITVNPLSGDFLVFRALSDLGGGGRRILMASCSHTLRPWCGPAGSRVAAGTVSGWGSLSSVSSFLFY